MFDKVHNMPLTSTNIFLHDNSYGTQSWITITAQKMKFSIKDFFSKCDQIRRELRI